MDVNNVALVTGVGRSQGIGAAIALALAEQGSDVAVTWWAPYDERVHAATDHSFIDDVVREIEAMGRRCVALEADLANVITPALLFDSVRDQLGMVSSLILSHCESVDGGIVDTTIESFDRHFAVNARASWLLMKEFATRFNGPFGTGRIVSLTSDHVVGNLAYGASKGALDRITVAAAREFAELGITANVINPGPTDTGWMDEELRVNVAHRTPLRRLASPTDCARLVAFLCSDRGVWINGQILHSDGGINS